MSDHMIFDDSFFLRESIVDVNAAIVGISKNRWIAVAQDMANIEQAAEIMRVNRFDVLPITNGSIVREYFQADRWNDYSAISRKTITHRDVVPCQTSIRDVIKGFTTEARLFYFLSNDNRIVGLISVANLNSRQVKVYLFSLLSELEVRLGHFISERVPEAELLNMTFGDNDKEKYEALKNRYKQDKDKGVEVPFVEYLYLSDLINIVLEKDLHSAIGYSRKQFKNDFGALNDLRHSVAHPTRSIIVDEGSVSRLWRRIDRIEEALFKLR